MKKYFPLIIILILAAVLRFAVINRYPAGLNADEAALGYNAYSLLLTGKDEHGNIMPVNLESFGDYKPALYSYLLVPIVKTFGLTEFTVRSPSALFGVLAVFLIYVLVKIISENSIAQIAALFLAISPWHLHFSRGAWEVNVATTLILLGAIFLLKWTRNNKFKTLVYCLVPMALSMYAYQSARVIAPALGLGLVVVYWKNFIGNLKQSIFAAFLLLLLLTPLFLSLIFTPAASRAGGVGLLADSGPFNFVNEVRGQVSGRFSLIDRFLYNRPVIYSIQFIKNYLSHFDGNFLFVNGDEIQRNRVPETGLLYFTDFVLLAFGFIYLANDKSQKTKRLIFLWLFIAPVASAMTFQVPHALRAQNMVIPLTLISACGLYYLFNKISLLTPLFGKERGIKGVRFLGLSIILIVYGWQFTRYLHEYYIHYPRNYPIAWEYGFRDLVKYVQANQSRYQKVLVTDKYDQPYILFLFYSRFNPRQFQKNHQLTLRDKYNFSTVTEFDKYVFTDTNWDKVRDDHGALIAAAGDDIPSVGVNIVETINFPNNQPAFKIISN